MTVFVPLARPPFMSYLNGSKTVEIRNARSPVAAQVRKAQPGEKVTLRLGYSGQMELSGRLGRVWEGEGGSNLPCGLPDWVVAHAAVDWNARLGNPASAHYFAWDQRLLAFEILPPEGQANLAPPTNQGGA